MCMSDGVMCVINRFESAKLNRSRFRDVFVLFLNFRSSISCISSGVVMSVCSMSEKSPLHTLLR